MARDIALIDDNFGFDPSMMRCGTDKEILYAWRQCREALNYRQTFAPEVGAYSRLITTDQRFRNRMENMHNFVFQVYFDGNRIVGFDPAPDRLGQAIAIRCATERAQTGSLQDLFPEPEAAPMISAIEDYCFTAQRIHRSESVAIGFHTKIHDNSSYFHTDDFVVSVLQIESPTIVVPKSACISIEQDGRRLARQYRCLDYSQVRQLMPGDILIANNEMVHAECSRRYAVPGAHSRLAIRAQPNLMALDLD